MIYGFIHTYTVNNWKDILEEQLNEIVRSGLYDKVEKIFIGVNGDERFSYWLAVTYKKFEVLYQFSKPELEQSLTLSFLRLFARKNLGSKIFYIHSKGVTHKDSKPQNDWRKMMEHYIITQHESCLHELERSDVVGVNWHLGEGYMGATAKKCGGVQVTPHFSGNFWWANAEYLERLPSLFPLVNKYQCEFWIGLNNPCVAELWNSGLHHHRLSYAKWNYEGRKHVEYYRGADIIIH